MRIDQLPPLPASAGTVKVPCSFNGADYAGEMEANTAVNTWQSGDAINASLYGFGYVSSSAKVLTFIAMTPKMFNAGASVSLTLLLAAVRVVGGGYLSSVLNNDLTSLVTDITCSGTALIITISSPTAWEYGSGGSSSGAIPNNTPVAGYVTVQLAVN